MVANDSQYWNAIKMFYLGRVEGDTGCTKKHIIAFVYPIIGHLAKKINYMFLRHFFKKTMRDLLFYILLKKCL